MPMLDRRGLWPSQGVAIENLEHSLAEDRPRALIQMATGSGKTFTAANMAYRLIKHADAHRILFLVDRANLGRQTLNEFQQFSTPDDGRKFTELYNVQHLTSNKLDPLARVTISTIQRLYSMLRGEEEMDETEDEKSATEVEPMRPVEVEYNPAIPIEAFDFIIVDECHRSIYGLWRQVLEYFDAHLIGLTATPSKQTFGFFHQNLVMEYDHAAAVADNVNVDFDVYRIQTRITAQGARVEEGEWVGFRDRATRAERWDRLDEPLQYNPTDLDRRVLAKDQIRTVIRTFRDRLFTEIFPGRGSSAKASANVPGGVPMLRMGNIINGALDYQNLKYLPADHPETAKFALAPGDLLFNRTNSPELVGKSAVFRGYSGGATFASYLVRVRFTDAANPAFVAAYINSTAGRKYIASVRSQQVGQANVNASKLAAMPIPLPSCGEQGQIVSEMERQFSILDAMETTVNTGLVRAERLRQAILREAFAGRLVPQDPADEPASALLARIAGERAKV